MEIVDARIMAKRLMEEHGIAPSSGWRVELDNGKKRLGATHYSTRKITLSKYLIALNDEEVVRQVILHEIAHVLAGHSAGHGIMWQRQARAIGYVGGRTDKVAITPKGRYQAKCATCGAMHYRHRKSAQMLTSACAKCCRARNGGKYSRDYLLSWVDTGVTAG